MSRQYRAWRDLLIQSIEECSLPNDSYKLVHTANLVGLFSCVFIKSSQRGRLSNINTGEVKRGMGGLHGNKVNGKVDIHSGLIKKLIRLRAL